MRGIAVRCGALLLAAVASLAILEAGVRVWGRQGDLFKVAAEGVYIGYAPNMRGTYVSAADPTLRASIAINGAGYRGPEWGEGKARRIAFLGDSFTASFELPYELTFPALIARDLARESGVVQEMNFGVAGTGTGLQVLYLEQDVLPRNPERVIHQVYVGNDFSDNSRVHSWKRYYPFWELAGEGLVLHPPEQGIPRILELARHLRAVGLAYSVYHRLKAPPKRALSPSPLYRTRPPKEWGEAEALTLALLDRSWRACRDAGVPYVVLLVPEHRQLEGVGLEESDRPQRIIREHLEGRAVIVDLLPLLRRGSAARGSTEWYRLARDGHFSIEGHRTVADALLPAIFEGGSSPR